jgi:hypothetical protein
MQGSCRAWGSSMTCQTPQTCEPDGTSASCECPAGSCTVGTRQCGPGGGVRECTSNDACGRWGDESSCSPYAACSNAACKKTCSSDLDCAATFICEGQACIPQCSAPSSANVVRNAGLDRTVDGFGPGTWSSEDGVGCTSSGSLQLITQPGRSDSFPVSAGSSYFVGYMAKNQGLNILSGCDIDWCNSMFCGMVLRTDQVPGPGTSSSRWERIGTQLVAPTGTVAARLTCRTNGSTLFDRFYVSSAAARF